MILGAGLTGLAAAARLEELGESDYLLVEKEDRPGGWATTDWTGAYGADKGVHVLYFRDDEVRGHVEELLGGKWIRHEKRCVVDSGGIRTPFPFHANLHGRPPEVVEECVAGLRIASADQTNIGAAPGRWCASPLQERRGRRRASLVGRRDPEARQTSFDDLRWTAVKVGMERERRPDTATVDDAALLVSVPSASQELLHVASHPVVPEVEDVDPLVGAVLAGPNGRCPPSRAISLLHQEEVALAELLEPGWLPPGR